MFQHAHSLARSPYTDAVIAPEAIGTLLLLPAAAREGEAPFDLVDLTTCQTLAIRMDDYMLCAVFDDSCAVLHGLRNLIARLGGPLSTPQIREMAAHVACCNMHLVNRPEFSTRLLNGDPPTVHIEGSHGPSASFKDRDKALFGELMDRVLGEDADKLHVDKLPVPELRRQMLTGELSFIFDDDGNFIAQR